MQTVGQLLVSLLKANGVDRMFCVPGESYLPLLDALVQSGIDTVTARHEGSAGFMALADGRLANRPGVFAVSRGPGATNAAIAVHSAQQDGTPLILFIGQVPRKNLGRDSFQEIDYHQMYGGIAKWVAEVTDPARLPEIITRAFTVAMQPTPGPVVISLPEELLELAVADDAPVRAATLPVSAPAAQPAGDVLEMLGSSQRPLIIAGGEFATDEERTSLRIFAERFQIPVVVGFRRLGVFPAEHPLYAGDLGVSTTKEQIASFERADLILALGTRLNEWTTLDFSFPTTPWPKQRLIHVCGDGTAIGRNIQPTLGIAGRAPDFVAAMLASHGGTTAAADAQDRKAWISPMAAEAAARRAWKTQQFADGVAFGNVIQALSAQCRDGVNMVPDAGISAALVYRYFPFGGERKLYSTISGVMGYGVPASVAIAMREPRHPVVCLVGDGSFMMTGNEIAIAVERGLPVKIFLSNNRSLGTIRMHQEIAYPGRAHATDLSGPDFHLLAKAFGCTALSIDTDAHIAPTVAAAFATAGPVLVQVRASISSIMPSRRAE